MFTSTLYKQLHFRQNCHSDFVVCSSAVCVAGRDGNAVLTKDTISSFSRSTLSFPIVGTLRTVLADLPYHLLIPSYSRYVVVSAVIAKTEPDNFPRLMELMQDMQEHGQVINLIT